MLFRSVLSRILPIPGTRTDSTIFRYSPRQFFCTLTDSTYSRHSHGFYRFPILTKFLTFFGSRPNRFSVLSRILSIPGTRTDSTIFRYSHGFYPFLVLARKVFCYYHRFYLFPALARILQFSGTHKGSTFSGTRPDSFFVLSRILPIPGTRTDSTISGTHKGSTFSGTRPDSFLVLSRILPIPGTRTDSTIFRYSQRLYLFRNSPV